MDKATLLIIQYDALLHKVLHQEGMHLGAKSRLYDDYLQELRLKLLDVARRFEGDPLSEDKEERYQFIAYARKALMWHTRNLLRVDKAMREAPQDDQLLIFDCDGDLVMPNVDEQLSLEMFCQVAKLKLTDAEWDLFASLVMDDQLACDYAREHHISKQVVSKRKHRIKEKLQSLKKLYF